MDFFEVVDTRRSIRAFTGQPIEPDKLQRILETANRAPSAGNLQAYEMHVVTHRACRRALARAALDQDFIAQAPAAIVLCALPDRSAAKHGERGASLYCMQDATIACAYAQLAATALGLASVWVGAFDTEAVRKAIDVAADALPIAILPIGYAAEHPDAASRRPLDDLVHYIR